MMKRIIAYLLTLVLLLSLCCSCAHNSNQNGDGSSFSPSQIKVEPIEAKRFIVNKKDISDTATAFIYSDQYAVIPLIAVSKALGAEVKWNSKTEAVITVNGKDYILDTSKNELRYAANGTDMFMGVPGAPGNMYCYNQQVGEEYYIDNWQPQAFLNEFGVDRVVIFFYGSGVFINKKETEPDIYGEFSVKDYDEEIQRQALDLEKAKDTMSPEMRSAYLKSYGDLTTARSVKYAALEVFEQLYDCNFFTLTEVKVYRDQASSCWMAKTKSVKELSVYKNEVPYIYKPDYDYDWFAIFTDDGRLRLAKEEY